MSKYKVGFFVNSRANIRSTNAEVFDLIDDYGYTEEKAEEIIKDEEKIKEEVEEWQKEGNRVDKKILNKLMIDSKKFA